MEPSSLFQLMMSRSEGLGRYIDLAIPARMKRTVSADDILQDIWVTVIRSASDITSSGSDKFDPWLTRIAQRRIADAIRRAGALKRGGRANVVYERRQTTSFVGLFDRACGPQITPSREVSAKEATCAVQIALTTLPENYREALIRRYIDDESHSDIARALNLSRSAVNSLLFRALRKLKEVLGPTGRFFSDDGALSDSAHAIDISRRAVR